VPFPSLSISLAEQSLYAASLAHSRHVRVLRMVLPIVAAVLVAAVLAWPQRQTQSGQSLIMDAAQSGGLAAGPQMINPRLISVGADQKPLRIQAASALQPQGPSGPILLKAPQAELILKSGDKATIAAGTATFHPNQPDDLQLQGGVRFIDAKGNTLSGKDLTVDTARQVAFSRKPVEGQFASGAIQADGITITEGGALIRFQGKTTSRFDLDTSSGTQHD
jgi:lipopolysaccharide export system protein LptC